MQTQAYFDDIQLHILHELHKATTSIHIAVAWFTDAEIFEQLCVKAASGVRVELIVVNDSINRNSSIDYERLRELGGVFMMVGDKKKSSSIMHNKFCVIDSATVITGSYNWSRQAQQNSENITVISDHPELAQQFIHEFESIFERHSGRGAIGADLGKIVARLEALRHVIDLDDEDDIKLQLAKLKKLVVSCSNYPEVKEIITFVETEHFDKAIAGIEVFVNSRKQLTVYVDQEIFDLKLELKSLEIQISALEDEKAESEKQLHAFQFRYTTELGELVRKILWQRMETLRSRVQQEPDKQEQFEEAKNDYEQFTSDCDESRKHDALELTIEQQKELKAKYRACSKLCHPDVVAPEHVEDAKRLFSQLNEANEHNDLETVTRIYTNLQKGIFMAASESITDSQKLHRAVVRMREKVSELNASIRIIRQSNSYQKLSAITEWDSYFINTRTELEDELKRLEIND